MPVPLHGRGGAQFHTRRSEAHWLRLGGNQWAGCEDSAGVMGQVEPVGRNESLLGAGTRSFEASDFCV